MGDLIYKEEQDIADNCRNCGMCRIDYLGTGRCHAAEEHVNFAHHPHGRLKIFRALASGELPLTTETQKVIDSCTLCGKCNIQCYFQIEMTPGDVFAAKRKVFAERNKTEAVMVWESDEVLDRLRAIVGENWAFNDPTILMSYATFASFSSEEKIPAYVVLPENTEQTAAIVKLANEKSIPFLPISSGTNSSNIIQDKIIMIDTGRMKTLNINSEENTAEVGAGILAFDLQKAAMQQGLRFSIGESAAGVCANQVSTGIHSFFGYKKGLMADHYIEAEMVTPEGDIKVIRSAEAPQIPTRPSDYYQPSLPGICTRLVLRLFPVEADETIVLVPFNDMYEGLSFSKDLAERGLGTAMAFSGVEVLSEFLSMTEYDADNFLDIASYYLKIKYTNMMMITQRDLVKVKQLYPHLTIIDQDSIQKIIQGIPAITGPESMALIEDVMDEEKPYDILFTDMLDYFVRQISLRDDEVRELFSNLKNKALKNTLSKRYFDDPYSNPEYWFNYRMFAPRFLRKHWFFSVMYFIDADDFSLIDELCERNKRFGEIHNIKNEFCYILPLDGGKRFFFEYEFFCDQRDADMLKRLKKVFMLIAHESKRMVKDKKGIYPVLNTLFHGLNQRNYYLYGNLEETEKNVGETACA